MSFSATSDLRLDLDKTPIPILQGPGALQQLGALVASLPAKRALIVTDPGILKAGHVASAQQSLEASGIAVAIFDGVKENPTTIEVDHCVQAAQAHHADVLIGLGGGSSMDCAKGCNFILTNGGRMQDYWGVDKAKKPMLPFIAIPTTAGTGSECQRFALITEPDSHQKMACGDTKTAARAAILDPTLTLTQPPFVTACTAMDAVAHAIETAVTNKATPDSLCYAHEALRLIIPGLKKVIADPSNLAARGQVQIAAALAGTAIEMSMLGIAHSMANPLTAHYDIVHGQAVSLVLPGVIQFNAMDPATAEGYRALVVAADLGDAGISSTEAVDRLVHELNDLLALTGLQQPLAQWGFQPEEIPMLAKEAAQQWTALFNPRPCTESDFEGLYRKVSGAGS